MKLYLIALGMTLAATAIFGTEIRDNRAINGGFEDTVVFPESQPYAKTMREGGWALDTPILRPKGWTPNPVGKQGEFQIIRDKAQAHSGEICVSLKGDLTGDEHIAVKPGDKVTIQFWAKSPTPGKVTACFYVYPISRDAFQQTESVSENWAKYSHTFEIPDQLDGSIVTTVVPVVRSSTGALFDDVEVLVNKVAQIDLVISQADNTKKTLSVFNGDFDDWQTLTPAPENWDLNAGSFPCKWLTEKRPDEKGSLRRMVNNGEDRKSFGNYSLLLNGRIVSEYFLGDVLNKELLISFWARGEGGHVDLRVRLYSSPTAKPEDAGQLGRVMMVNSDGAWKEYSGTMLAHGNNIYGARLEVIGQGVVIDNLRVVVSGKANADKKEVFQPIMSIPILKEGPKLTGGFSEEQWKDALEIRNGFMNMQTGNSVLRQTACRLATDGKKLFISTKCRMDGELKAVVRQRDGNVWEDDSVEVYINPFYDREKSPARVYQFVVNSNGAVYDHSVEVSIGQPPDASWNCKNLEVKSEMVGKDWVVMLAIPLSEVGLVPGKQWGLNLCRTLKNPGENTSLTGGRYQDWKRMVACSLDADAPIVAWGYTGNLKEGGLGATVTIGNLSATHQAYQVGIDIGGNGQPDRKQVQTVNVAPAAFQQVIVEGDDQKLDKGQVNIQIVDAKGKVWFSEALPFDRQEIKAASKKAAAAPAEQQRWRLEYFPVQGKINIRILALSNRCDLQLGKRFGQTLVSIYRNDQLILEKTVDKPLIVADEGHVTVPFLPKEDGVYFVRAMICDEKGDCMDFVSGSIEKQPMPWLGNSLGKGAVIVPPFTPMKTKGQTISCLGRDYKLDASGLPAVITANGEQALAAPAMFELVDENGKQSGKMSGGKLLDCAEDRITFQGQMHFTGMDVNIKGWAEYDGVLRYEVELLPKSELSVKSFSLDVPVNDVKYMHAVSGMRITTTIFAMTAPVAGEYRDTRVPLWSPDHVYKSTFDPFTLYLPTDDGVIWSSHGVSTRKVYGNFMPYIWIGNARYGVTWFADNDRGWNHDVDSTCLELVRKGVVTTLRVHFIAKPVKLTAPRKFVFGLMATPVKPRVTGGNNAIKVAAMGFGMQFMERWSSVSFADYFLAKNLKQKRNATTGSALIYIANDLFNANDPVMRSLKDEWARTPASADQHMGMFPLKMYGSNQEDYDSRLVCAEGSRVDYQIAGLDRCMREGALDGVYMDNSCPVPCVNIQHENCGYVREDGQVQAGWHLFETRDLIKRSATLSYQHHSNWPWWAIHSTSAMVASCFSFADICIDGEWGHDGKDFMDFFTLPYLEVFGAGAWGLNPGWLPKLHGMEREIKPTRTLLAALKLYDMFIWMNYCNIPLVQKFTDLEKTFGTTEKDCRFVGYWEKDAGAVAGLPVDVKSSFYVRPGKGALIYVANFAREPRSVKIKLDFTKFGIANGQLLDGENQQEIKSEGDVYPLSVEGHDFRVLKLKETSK